MDSICSQKDVCSSCGPVDKSDRKLTGALFNINRAKSFRKVEAI